MVNLDYFLFLLVSRTGTVGWTKRRVKVPKSAVAVWCLVMEVKNKYAYVITQDICNKFNEVNFFVGCMISRPNHLLQRLTTMSLINKIPYSCNQEHVLVSNTIKDFPTVYEGEIAVATLKARKIRQRTRLEL